MHHKLKIHGMHCVSCEILLEKSLNKIHGAKVISVNHKNGDLTVDIDNDSCIAKIENVIKSMNYSFVGNKQEIDSGSSPEGQNNIQDYIEIIGSFLVLGVLVFLFRDLDIASKMPTISGNIGILIALLLGVVASVSTCLALLGGIVISFGSTMTELEKEKTFWEKARPHVYFNLGRIIGFSILGGILGVIGKTFLISPSVNGAITVIIAFVMLYMGLHILGFLPSITKLGFHLPKIFTKDIDKLICHSEFNSESRKKGTDSGSSPEGQFRRHSLMPAIVGVMTFFLPCGFTQSAQLASIASGNGITGALIMGAFALGTTPVLFALGTGSSMVQKSEFGILKKLIGVLVIFFALYSFSNGMRLNGVNLSFNTQSNIEEQNNQNSDNEIAEDSDEVQTINVIHTGRSLDPYSIKLKAGKKYKLIITPENNGQGCMFAMFIPKVDESPKYVKKGEKIEYNIKGLSRGRYDIICTSMGMQHGELIVN